MEQILRNVDRRVGRIEQFLPALSTKADLQAAIASAIAPLATKAELQAAVAPLATKAELRAAISSAITPLATQAELREVTVELRVAITESEHRMRTHFDVVTESLRDDIQIIATGLATFWQRER